MFPIPSAIPAAAIAVAVAAAAAAAAGAFAFAAELLLCDLPFLKVRNLTAYVCFFANVFLYVRQA